MNEFEKAMIKSGVTPLKKDNRVILKTSSTHHSINLPNYKNKKSEQSDYDLSDISNINSFHITTNINKNDSIYFCQNGVNPKTIKKMKQGKLEQIPPCLDLHGYKVDGAKIKLTQFLNQPKHRYLQIIHGKGYHSDENQPILKNLVASFLQNHSNVLAVCSCPINEGGTGAVYVLLKK
jgi:DNA-nicking Smr family endonuclease